MWLGIGTGGGLLWTRWWTSLFHSMWVIYWPGGELLAFQERLCSAELAGFTEYSHKKSKVHPGHIPLHLQFPCIQISFWRYLFHILLKTPAPISEVSRIPYPIHLMNVCSKRTTITLYTLPRNSPCVMIASLISTIYIYIYIYIPYTWYNIINKSKTTF